MQSHWEAAPLECSVPHIRYFFSTTHVQITHGFGVLEAVVIQLEKSLSVELLLVDYHRMLFDPSTGISVRSHWKKLKKCV